MSVITPSLNSGRFLNECLASVAAQTYPNVEHIVVDGESTDDTPVLLARHARQRLRVIVRRDRSMYEAINNGLAAAKGEILACLNADDFYFPDGVDYVVRFMQANPTADIVYGDQLSLFVPTESFDIGYCPAEGADPWGRTLVYISQPAVFLRKRAIEKIGLFDAGQRAAADFDYWMRAYLAGATFKKFRRVVVAVRMHGANLSLGDAWQREHAELKERYLQDRHSGFWDAVRLARRRVLLNRLTFPLFMRGVAREHVSFSVFSYFAYLASGRRREAPILSIRLPFFRYSAHRALCIET